MPEPIFKQLCKAAQTATPPFNPKQQIEQSDQEYLTSLVRSFATISDENWDKYLTAEAQEWVNQAIILLNKRTDPKLDPFPIPLTAFCPGFIGREEAEKVVKTKPKDLPRGLSASEVFATQPVPKTLHGTGKRGKKPTTGVTDYTRRIIVQHPEWTVRQVWEYLRLNGFPAAKVDSVAVARGDIRRIMEIMKELGWQEPQGVTVEPEEETVTK